MKKLVMTSIALTVLGAGAGIALWKTQTSSRQHGRLAALKQLRDSGVISAQEYDSKIESLRASVSAVAALSNCAIPA